MGTQSGTKGTKDISKDYPVVDGIVAETTTQEGHKIQMEATKGSLVRKFRKEHLDGR